MTSEHQKYAIPRGICSVVHHQAISDRHIELKDGVDEDSSCTSPAREGKFSKHFARGHTLVSLRVTCVVPECAVVYGDASWNDVAAPVVVEANRHAPGIPSVLVRPRIGNWAIVLKDGVRNMNS